MRSLFVAAGLFFLPCLRADPTAPGLRPWTDYHVILWTGESASKRPELYPLFFKRLREMGVDTGMVYGGGGDPAPLLTNEFPYYVENIVNRGLCLKWNSRVIDWDKVVTDWDARGRPESALVREYSLDDPSWQGQAEKEMQAAAQKHAPHHPLAYNIRDELSVTISANPFDYDFGPAALQGFRAWLKTRYSTLAALNEEWETAFPTWEEVRPFTTDQIKNRMASGVANPSGRPDWQGLQRLSFDPKKARRAPTRWNFAPWADFRSYMDVSLARTLSSLRRAAHEVDARTPVGIEGTQMPSAFGGYDWARLSQALDWVEPYDIGSAREIVGSFMPDKPILTTVFEHETNPARRRLWHLLLEGDRGCIVWWSEDCLDWQTPDYALTAKARALAPVLREMKSPLARLFLVAKRESDPIELLYSQPSIQVDWLLESTVDGSTWLRRFSSFEADHNRQAERRDAWLKCLQDLGYSPHFVTRVDPAATFASSLHPVLVLPTAWALSVRDQEGVLDWVKRGGTVLADGTPGLFDEHGRLSIQNSLEPLFPLARPDQSVFRVGGGVAARSGDIADYARERLRANPDLSWAGWAEHQLARVARVVTVPVAARVRVFRYRLGTAQLVAFERNVDYQMSEELRQAGGNEALEAPVSFEAKLARKAHVYDLRRRAYLGETARIPITLDPWQPALFALLPERTAPEEIIDHLLAQAQARSADR